NGHGAHASGELEVATREFVEGALVLKEDDLAVGLPAGLKTDTDLRHRRVADVFPLLVDSSLAVCRADPETSLADAGKHRITVAVIEEFRTLAGFLEDFDGVGVFVRPGQRTGEYQHRKNECRDSSLHDLLLQDSGLPATSKGAEILD